MPCSNPRWHRLLLLELTSGFGARCLALPWCPASTALAAEATKSWLGRARGCVSTAFASPPQSATKGTDRPSLKMIPSLSARRPWSAALLCLLLSTCAAASATATDDAAAASSSKVSNKKCQTLHTSMTYSQDKAPRDISAVLPQIVQKVNEALEGVVDVEVKWEGGEPMHRRVGEHQVEMDVTRLLSAVGKDRYSADSSSASASGDATTASSTTQDEFGRDVITQCFIFPFQILDTDECTLPSGHVMRHRCAAPSYCVNTIGSYECVCPVGGRSGADPLLGLGSGSGKVADDQYFADLASQKRTAWDLSLASSSASSCPGSPSTRSCCKDGQSGSAASGDDCRAAFRCPVDPCGASGDNDCASSARCVRSGSPLDRPQYQCQCPSGLMGNGKACRKGIDAKPRPMVEYDGVTPTAETLRNDFYCGCTKPVVDPCAGFPKCEEKHKVCTVTSGNTPMCACKPGYVEVDGWGCVDETPPLLKLRHDPETNGINRIKQGDRYEEHAVDIDDDNAEQYARQLKITYSRPLPPGCLTHIGQFHVNYTVATPWTNPPFARVTRTVVVENINECSINVDRYKTQCPQLIPQCDIAAGAVCADTIGSYTCKCPQHTSGDGFLPIAKLEKDGRGRYVDAPEGYSGGTSCRDTSKPILEVVGPNPKVFRVCKCGGLRGIMGDSNKDGADDEVLQLQEDQKKHYEADIKEMIKQTAGAELCATHARPNPSPADCVRASDHTFRGVVDLSDRVTIGEPVKKGEGMWRIPYDVTDDAGNKAKTAYRTIRVEEIDLNDVERRLRDEILSDKQREIDRAVSIAVEKERRKQPVQPGAGSKKCPPCPDCNCPKTKNGLSDVQCQAMCDERMKRDGGTCAPGDDRTLPKENLHPFLGGIIDALETMLSPTMLLIIFLVSFMALVLIFLQRFVQALANPQGSMYYTKEDEERERAMLNSVSYYRSPGGASAATAGATARTPGSGIPSRSMLSGAAVGNGVFSPPENRMYQQREVFSPQQQQQQQANIGGGSIYNSMSPITPSRSNGSAVGAAAGTPYNLRRRY